MFLIASHEAVLPIFRDRPGPQDPGNLLSSFAKAFKKSLRPPGTRAGSPLRSPPRGRFGVSFAPGKEIRCEGFSMTVTLEAPVRLAPGEGRADSTLVWANANGKRVFLLSQAGRFEDCCYDHGRLLAAEIEKGVIPEILDTIRTSTDTGSELGNWIADAIYRRMSDDVFSACGPEFRAAIRGMSDGYFDGLDDPDFTPKELEDASVAIDVGNLATGLARRMEKYLAAEVSETIGYIIGAAIRYRRGRAERNLSTAIAADRAGVSRGVQRLRRPWRRAGFGCTGFAAAGTLTADGRALHGRTFDSAFFSWNAAPGLFLMDERASDPGYLRYAAMGTAGLPYPGGISGINEAGIGVSLHQMSTVNYDTGRPGRGYEIAPMVQQRVLREARTLDEAVDLIRGARHFAAWTILVSDGAAGRSVRVELTGEKGKVRALDEADRIVQTNHFLHPDLAEAHDFFGDAHFTPTLGKWMESRARLETISGALEAAAGGTADTDWALSMLASHADGALGGAQRSFGRTICKAYGITGSIVRADTDRARQNDEIWVSTGARLPGNHSDFIGMAIDWEGLTLSPVADRPLRTPATLDAPMTAALGHYVAAFRALSRPTDAAGAYLGRDPNPVEEREIFRTTLAHLDRAVASAEDAGHIDLAFRFMRARVAHRCGEFARARSDWDFLDHLAAMNTLPVHDYEKALIEIFGAATMAAQGDEDAAATRLDRGEALLDKVAKKLFGDGKRHKGVADLKKVASAIRADGAGADLPEPEFVTVE